VTRWNQPGFPGWTDLLGNAWGRSWSGGRPLFNPAERRGTTINTRTGDRMAAYRKLDQRRVYLCAGGLRKRAANYLSERPVCFPSRASAYRVHRNTVTGTRKGSRGGWGKAMVSTMVFRCSAAREHQSNGQYQYCFHFCAPLIVAESFAMRHSKAILARF
jgi:hypothetical protein